MAYLTIHDRIHAELLGAGSGLVQHLPAVGRLVGGSDSVNYLPLRWFHSRQAVRSINAWQEFPADPVRGRLPSSFKLAAIFRMDKAAIDEYEAVSGGCQAVAYRLGKTAVMIGVTPDNAPLFGNDSSDDSSYVVAMRIGKGSLSATAGIWSPQHKLLTEQAIVSSTRPLPIGALLNTVPVV